MRAVVVGLTHMGPRNACVGALDVDNGTSLRLKLPPDEYPPRDWVEVGEVLEFDAHPIGGLEPPHLEDVVVFWARKVGEQGRLRALVLDLVEPWIGRHDAIFDGCLTLNTTSGGCYLQEDQQLPSSSTGFWIPTVDLEAHDGHFLSGGLKMPYVGLADCPAVIPAGSLVRVSLAKWWNPEGRFPTRRCYANVSGVIEDLG